MATANTETRETSEENRSGGQMRNQPDSQNTEIDQLYKASRPSPAGTPVKPPQVGNTATSDDPVAMDTEDTPGVTDVPAAQPVIPQDTLETAEPKGTQLGPQGRGVTAAPEASPKGAQKPGVNKSSQPKYQVTASPAREMMCARLMRMAIRSGPPGPPRGL